MAGVNFDDVWKEVSDPEFVNQEPENEYDINVVTRTFKLMNCRQRLKNCKSNYMRRVF